MVAGMSQERPFIPADVKWYMEELAKDQARIWQLHEDETEDEQNQRIALEVAQKYAATQACTLRDVAPELAWTKGDQSLFDGFCRFQEAP